MTVVQKSHGRIVLEFTFGTAELQKSRSGNGALLTSTSCGSAIQSKEGYILPAEMLNIAAKPASVKITTSGEIDRTFDMSLIEPSEKNVYPIHTLHSHATTPFTRTIGGHTVETFFVTPFVVQSGEVKSYKKLRLVIDYTPQVGQVSNKPLSYLISRSVLNPAEIRVKNTPRATVTKRARAGSFVKSNEKALRFSIDNGISISSDVETDLNECNGLYRLTPIELSYLGNNVPVNSIRVRAANRMVYDSITPTPENMPLGLQEVDFIIRDMNQDGLFNGSDELLFYGSALHFWYFNRTIDNIDTITDGVTETYDTTFTGVWDFEFNDFDYKRYYWVTVGASSPMKSVTKEVGVGTPMTSGLRFRRTKIPTNLTTPDEENMGHASRDWKWQTVNQSIPTFTGTLEVYSPSLTDSVGVRMWIPKKRRSYNSDALINIGTRSYPLLLDEGMSDWYYGDLTAENFTFETASKNGKDYYYDVSAFDTRYRKNLDMLGATSPLHFYSEEAEGLVTYTISNIPATYTLVLRIDEKSNTSELMDTLTTGGIYSFTDSAGLGYEYVVAPVVSTKSISTAETFPQYTYNASNSYVVRDITDHAVNNDYIIISSPDFLPHSDSIAAYKKSQGLNPVIFSTEDMYREFSGGVQEPSAIRNGLTLLRASHGDLKYLLLFGGGHYDYKGYMYSEKNHIIPYVDDDEILVEDFYAYLDPFEDVTNSPAADMYVGRVPAKDVLDADTYIEKYHEMHNGQISSGDWENKVLLMNDDDSQQGKIDPVRGHEVSSDIVDDEIEDKKKDMFIQELNLFEYPFGGSFTKPKAKEALFNHIKEGSMMINYFGHGAYHAISDEKIFLSQDLPSLTNLNKGKYFIFSAFSCSVGFFDLPEKDAIASELLFINNGGAIASVSSTRTAYHDSNQKFGRAYFRELFDSTDAVRPLGLAYGIAKTFHNLNRYALLGDPAYAPYAKRTPIALTLKDKTGAISSTFKIFDQVTVSGSIPADMHSVDTNFVVVTLQNQERLDEKRKDGGGPENRDVTYDLPGNLLYKSQPIPVAGTSFDHVVKIPRSVFQDTLGVNFKAYIWNKTNTIAAGIIDTFLVSGVNLQELDTTDKSGPMIKARLANSDNTVSDLDFADAGERIIIDGFNVSKKYDSEDSVFQVTLEFMLKDSSGIDYTYDNAGEGITLEIKDVARLENLNSRFISSDGSKKGTITYQIEKEQIPGVGEYELTITARDILGNVTKEKYILDVKSMGEEQYTMGELFAYPSPVNMGKTTRFWFNETNSQVSKASLKIYSLDGRLLRHEKEVNSGFTWDLTDQKGGRLSPNVYLYRLFIERKKRDDNSGGSGDDTEIIKSPIKKIVIYPPSR